MKIDNGQVLNYRSSSKLNLSKKMYLDKLWLRYEFSDSEIVASILKNEGYTTTKD